jgi:hypothetical protein
MSSALEGLETARRAGWARAYTSETVAGQMLADLLADSDMSVRWDGTELRPWLEGHVAAWAAGARAPSFWVPAPGNRFAGLRDAGPYERAAAQRVAREALAVHLWRVDVDQAPARWTEGRA